MAMVGRINPNDDKNPLFSHDVFKHSYTSSQQRKINDHVGALKDLLQSGASEEQIEELREQILKQDLPAAGLNDRHSPTIADTMQYIDVESGYTAHLSEKPAPQVSSTKKSKRGGMRQVAGGSPSKPAAKPSLRLSAGDSLDTIKSNLTTWKNNHPGTLSNDVQNILNAIDALSQNGKLTGDALRSWMQLDADPQKGVKEIFNSAIYSKITPTDLQSLFNAVGLDKSLLPDTVKPSSPPFVQGYVAYVFKNLPDYQSDGKTPTTVQVGAHLNGGAQTYIQGINPDHTDVFTTDPAKGCIPKSELPTFTDADGKKQSYIYIPENMISGRIYYNWTPPTANAYPAFTEFNMDQWGNPDVNFSAVDNIPKLTSSVQLSSNDQLTNRNGIQSDSTAFFNKMSSLYDQYDPSGAWKKNMFFPDGSIRSGKHMGTTDTGDPTIQNTLSNYLNGSFFDYFSQHPLYFTADAPTPGAQQGILQRGPNGNLQIAITNLSTRQTVTMPLPAADNLNAWVSGAFGAQTGDSTPAENMQWGAAKALSSIINKGILPQDTNTSPDHPMNGANYFTDPANVSKFYQAPFYNVFLRSMHEAGCSAYGADFDDYMGGDGSVGADHSTQPFVTITFGNSAPTPPPSDFATAAMNELWNYKYPDPMPPGEMNFPETYQTELKNVTATINTYNDDLNTYNQISNPQDKLNYYKNTLTPAYQAASQMRDLFMQQGLAFNNLYSCQPEVNRILASELKGKPITLDQMSAIGHAIEARYVPAAPTLPTPPSPLGHRHLTSMHTKQDCSIGYNKMNHKQMAISARSSSTISLLKSIRTKSQACRRWLTG